MTVLQLRDLAVDFHTAEGTVSAVRGIDLDIAAGEAVAVVGESGSGKTVTGRAVLNLLPEHADVSGSVRFRDRELVGASEIVMRGVRGTGVGMVFQDSLDGLNPVYSVGAQMTEVLRVRRGLGRHEARVEAARLLEMVGISNPEKRLRAYPHQFSGGMRQRVCIALAIALRPELLIADEPTTALDVTVQAEILRLLADLQVEHGMALLFVTHDLAVARLVATQIVVMRAGLVVERGPIDQVFAAPRHPYTKALFAAHPGRASTWHDLTPIGDELDPEPTGMPDPSGRPTEEAISDGI